MTEQEWLNFTDPQPMLEFLRGKASDRKLRLFAVACCRRVWAWLKDERFRIAVRAAERFADGMATEGEMNEAREAAIPAFVQLHNGDDAAPAAAISVAKLPAPKKSPLDLLRDAFYDPWWEDEFDQGDALAPALVTARNAASAAAHAQGQRPRCGLPGEIEEQRQQSRLLRDIFGPLTFRPVRLDPAWLTPPVIQLAATIYDERAFDRLLILADSLEDAGCVSQDILNHCRLPGVHVRGCWALDLILGKE